VDATDRTRGATADGPAGDADTDADAPAADGTDPDRRRVRRGPSRRRSAVLWGLVGALSFLVLAQGYRLVTGEGVSPLATVAVALVVFAGTTGLSYALEPRLERVE
jgi:hypothetical protein